MYDFPKFLQDPAADQDLIPAINVTYSVEFVKSDTGRKPDTSDFLSFLTNSLMVFYTKD